MNSIGEVAQAAWKEYSEFMKASRQLLPMNETQAEQAFIFGFMNGAKIIGDSIRKPIKRNYTVKRVYRSSSEMKQQAQIISEFLKVQGRTTPLAAIIKHANRCGFHWTNKNASGFMLKIMEVNRHIKKAERGFYMYSRRERV